MALICVYAVLIGGALGYLLWKRKRMKGKSETGIVPSVKRTVYKAGRLVGEFPVASDANDFYRLCKKYGKALATTEFPHCWEIPPGLIKDAKLSTATDYYLSVHVICAGCQREFNLAYIDASAAAGMAKPDTCDCGSREAMVLYTGRPDLSSLVQTVRDDKDPNVRCTAVSALGATKNKLAIPALIEALKDKNAGVRMYAAEAIGQIGDKSAVSVLTEALKDEESYVQESAAEALGDLGDKSALPALQGVLRDKDRLFYKDTHRAAKEAIAKIKAKNK